MNQIQLLQQWYESHCDGEWEHSFGIHIDTLDNPGWAVIIDLNGTPLGHTEFNQSFERSQTDWVECKIENGQFFGYGGPLNLSTILEVFEELKTSALTKAV
jgi:Immunity protein 53